MDWETVVKAVGISGIMMGVIGYLIRSLFKQVLSFDLENHKHDLEKETERFRYELGITAFEHQTRFSALHIKRAEVIAELYNRLTQAERHATELIQFTDFENISPQDGLFTEAFASYSSLEEYLEPNKIWFSQGVCEKILNFSSALDLAITNLKTDAIFTERGQPIPGIRKEAWEKMTQVIPSVKSELEREFRGILGISPDKAK